MQRAAPDVRQAVALARLGQRALAVPGDDGVDARVLRLELLERRAAGLLGGDLAAHAGLPAGGWGGSCVTAAGPYTHPVSFRDDSQLDPSEVRDERGRGGLGGAFPGGRIAVGGGGLGLGGLVILLLLQFLGGGGSLGQLGDLQDQTSAGAPPGDLSDCRTGADANARQDCRIIGYVNSVQRFWKDEFARRGATYVPATTYFESDQWQTGCGPASTDVGPFYCPADKHVYIDLTFLDELHDKFGATGGSLAQGYVIAHEYGHHIQDLLGILGAGDDQQGAHGQVRAHGAAGRLLRRRVGLARDRDRLAEADHEDTDRRCAECGGGRRRRPHPVARPRARSTRRSGRTARRGSARPGSRPAIRPAT